MFQIEAKENSARAGVLVLGHGKVETPLFMPVGTQGTVKALAHPQLEELGFGLLLSNAFYLYLRPGPSLLEKCKLHEFIRWEGNILTDSGGYQMFNLSSLFEIEERGIHFRSPYDGTPYFLTPEDVVSFQELMGVDIAMVLDHCAPYPATEKEVKESVTRTISWAERSLRAWQKTGALFGIVQGGTHCAQRAFCARELSLLPFSGFAIGGLSVGEPKELLFPALRAAVSELPSEKPRYLMGVGTPEDILEAVKCGVDMFDCILPTRLGRSGTVFTSEGRISIKNAAFQADFQPLDPRCRCMTCTRFHRAYLRHLYKCEEITAMVLCTVHNLFFYRELLSRIRRAIQQGVLFQCSFKELFEL